MKKKKFYPYGINLKGEIKIYKNIVRRRTSDNQALLNRLKDYVYKIFKKYVKKEKQKRIRCSTYTSWRNHIVDILPKGINNYTDFIHWIYKKKRAAGEYLLAVRAVVIPIYLSIVTFYTGTLKEIESEKAQIVGFCFLISFITIISFVIIIGANIIINFYNDFIKIVEENENIISNKGKDYM